MNVALRSSRPPLTPSTPYEMCEADAEATATATTLKERGNAAFRSGRYAEALALYETALATVLTGSSPLLATTLHLNLAAAALHLHEFEKARAACCAALLLDPTNAKGRARLAQAASGLAAAAATPPPPQRPLLKRDIVYASFSRSCSRTAFRHSDDGVDENLLILLHGLGDSLEPFAKLGAAMRLPQTAMLALQARAEVPLLGGGYWFSSLEPATYEPYVDPPVDGSRLASLARTVGALCSDIVALCASHDWPLERVHLLGYGDGAAVALHVVAALAEQGGGGGMNVGSVAAVCGSLLPEFTAPVGGGQARATSTRVLLLATDASTGAEGGHSLAAAARTERELRSAALGVEHVVVESLVGSAPHMPRSAAEMTTLMRHFGGCLTRRMVALEGGGGFVEVHRGGQGSDT